MERKYPMIVSLDICSFLVDNEEEERIRSYSAWNDHRGDLRGPYQDHNIRCFAFVAKEGFCQRANTLNSYCELNRQVNRKRPFRYFLPCCKVYLYL